MFKYVRTMNSDCAPETTMITVTDDMKFYIGEICNVNEVGHLTSSITASMPKYLVVESKKMGDGKKELRCVRILEGMLFEADLTDDYFEILENGNTFCLGSDANSHKLFVSNQMGNDVEIISKLSHPQKPKVLVTFI